MLDKYVHLTNSSIQDKRKASASSYAHNNMKPPRDPIDGGSKLSLAYLKILLQKAGINWSKLWKSIQAVVVKSLACVEDHIDSSVSSFELFGYDVLIDTDLKPWIIEVNASPALACGTPLDHTIKPVLIKDVIQLVNPLPYDRQDMLQLLVKRLKTGSWDGTKPAKKTGERRKFVPATQEVTTNPATWAALQKVLGHVLPREYGQLPAQLGHFQPIAPSELYSKISTLKHSIPNRGRSLETRYRESFPVLV
jgi:hypothetical protein